MELVNVIKADKYFCITIVSDDKEGCYHGVHALGYGGGFWKDTCGKPPCEEISDFLTKCSRDYIKEHTGKGLKLGDAIHVRDSDSDEWQKAVFGGFESNMVTALNKTWRYSKPHTSED